MPTGRTELLEEVATIVTPETLLCLSICKLFAHKYDCTFQPPTGYFLLIQLGSFLFLFGSDGKPERDWGFDHQGGVIHLGHELAHPLMRRISKRHGIGAVPRADALACKVLRHPFIQLRCSLLDGNPQWFHGSYFCIPLRIIKSFFLIFKIVVAGLHAEMGHTKLVTHSTKVN